MPGLTTRRAVECSGYHHVQHSSRHSSCIDYPESVRWLFSIGQSLFTSYMATFSIPASATVFSLVDVSPAGLASFDVSIRYRLVQTGCHYQYERQPGIKDARELSPKP